MTNLESKSNADRPIVVSIAPSHSKGGGNQFIEQFARSVQDTNARVADFRWSLPLLARSDAVIFHWPDHFVSPSGRTGAAKAVIKLGLLRSIRAMFGTRFIWVAHNATPHDKAGSSQACADLFFDSLDGVIYLSTRSRQIVESLYPELARKPYLVTAHGHYRDSMALEPSSYPILGDEIRLCYFGQIRRYKNIPELARLIAGMSGYGVSLSIVGMKNDPVISSEIEIIAEGADNIACDLRPTPVPDAAMEAAIDASHAVVLPYSSVLNSGAAFLALSRNRPVIAPRIGSLIELQATVGPDWVYLYEGPLMIQVIVNCMSWLRSRPSVPAPDLSPFDWGPIGRSIRRFVAELIDRHPSRYSQR